MLILSKHLLSRTIEFMDKEVCHHLRRSCANDSVRKDCSNDSHGRRQTQGKGLQQERYELGGQARLIIESMGVGGMIILRGSVGVLAKTNMFPLLKKARFKRVFFCLRKLKLFRN